MKRVCLLFALVLAGGPIYSNRPARQLAAAIGVYHGAQPELDGDGAHCQAEG